MSWRSISPGFTEMWGSRGFSRFPQRPSGMSTAGTSTSLVQAAILYLVITLPLTQLVSYLEKRQRRSR